MCRIGLSVLPSLIGSLGTGTWQGAESQSWDAEVLGGETRTSSLSPSVDATTHKHPDALQKDTDTTVLHFGLDYNWYLQETAFPWRPRWRRDPRRWPHSPPTDGQGREGGEVLRGRQSEEAEVETETADGSPRPLGGPFCAGPRAASCCSDIQPSAGLSEVCWTAWSFSQRSLHPENMQRLVVRRPKNVFQQKKKELKVYCHLKQSQPHLSFTLFCLYAC